MSPQYEYQCPNCGAVCADKRTVDERNDGPRCYLSCKVKMELLISPVAGVVKDPAVPKGKS